MSPHPTVLVWKILKDTNFNMHLKHLLKLSTINGLRLAVRARYKDLCFCWTVITVLFISLAICQICDIVLKLQKHSVFAAITVSNVNPLRYFTLTDYQIHNPIFTQIKNSSFEKRLEAIEPKRRIMKEFDKLKKLNFSEHTVFCRLENGYHC